MIRNDLEEENGDLRQIPPTLKYILIEFESVIEIKKTYES